MVHWVNTWVWTFDPRKFATYPFDLFPRQEQFLCWLAEREVNQENGLAEKSRDVGFTWLCCCHAAHGWLFKRNYACGFGSRKLDLVDKLGDPDSILEKVRMLLRYLPQWMLPKGYSEAKHAGHCRILNPETGSYIGGEGGDNIGRGGRKSIYFVDEAAFLEHPQMVDAALVANTDVRIDVSTPNGVGNPFHTKRFGGAVAVFSFHYRDDPRKTEEWKLKKKASVDAVTWAQEYEIDYAASIEGIAIPAAWVRAAVDYVPAMVNRQYPLVAGLDVADGGKNKNALVTRRGPIVTDCERWQEGTTTETAWKARDHCRARGVKTLHYDVVGVGAGIRGTYKTASQPLGFTANAVNTGQPPSDSVWPSGKTSKELFVNLRAELWFVARRRFEKTYEVVTQGIEHPPDELISIPNDPELVAQLSMPLFQYTDTGKMKLESKQDMQKRGVASPDSADALIISFAPQPLGLKFL